MVRIIVSIDGMACEHCEARVSETLRGKFSVNKVKASHLKKEAEIIAEEPLDEQAVTEAVNALGFTVTGVRSEPYEKKSFTLFRK